MTVKDNPIDTRVDEIREWKLYDWTGISTNPIPMSDNEIKEAIKYLRDNHYPKPADCPMEKCAGYRPACQLGICYAAIRLCGDF